MAVKRIPDSVIRESIVQWSGNVQAAAEQLGMSRNNLYKRLVALGVEPAALRRGRRSAGVSSVAPSDLPVKTLRIRLTARVLPAHVDRLRQAKYDLSARYRVETDETTILAQFIDEALDGWLAGKLAAKS
jgi:hypothetical protein